MSLSCLAVSDLDTCGLGVGDRAVVMEEHMASDGDVNKLVMPYTACKERL